MRSEAEIRTIAIGDFRRTLEALNVDDLTAEGRVADFAAGWDELTADNAALRAAVKQLRTACEAAVPSLDSFIPDDDLHSPNNAALFGLTQALAATSKFEEPST